jgi:aminoglycoside phosphotransferase (APT) family kinase protein
MWWFCIERIMAEHAACVVPVPVTVWCIMTMGTGEFMLVELRQGLAPHVALSTKLGHAVE